MSEISVCSSVSSGCLSLDVLLAGASHLVTCERLPRRDAIWPLAERFVGSDGDGECSLSALKDRPSVDVVLVDYYCTNRPPCIGRGYRVRLVVDSTLPVGGSV
jgi:hypothetical protein